MRKHSSWLKRIAVPAAGMLLLASPLSSAFALTVDGPGMVLMIDGDDSNTTVHISTVDATFPISEYEFGFLSGGNFTSITSTIDWSYTFSGGDVVDFALRKIANNTIYDIAHPNDYANQIYSDLSSIDPMYSQNPQVSSPYYHSLLLVWDLNGDGSMDPGFGFTITPLLSHDGMAPTVVPVPAAIWLFGSGLLGLVALVRRRKQPN